MMHHVHQLEEHGKKAEHRVGGRAVRRVHGRRNRMVGAMHERVAVDDGDSLRHGGPFCRDAQMARGARRAARPAWLYEFQR